MHRIVWAVGKTEIVENVVEFLGRNLIPDRCFDLVGQTCSLFDARSGSGANVQNELAGIRAWKEILPEERKQQESTEARAEEHGNKDLARDDKFRQQELICGAQAFKQILETALEANERIFACSSLLGSHQVHGERRHECKR